MNPLQTLFSDFKSNSIQIYCFQMLVVLSGTTLGLFFLNAHHAIVPITLGAIATALTDVDDRLSIRLRNLGLVCLLFFSVSAILEFLYPYKLLFIAYLSVSSALLILMGALGQRYATISFGTVLLSIYTMFGLGEYEHWYTQSSYFLMGTLWYGLCSILFFLLKPTQAVQDHLSASFKELADLLNQKARLFDPDNTHNVETLLYELSLKNSTVVQSLNQTKATLLTRLKASRANQNTIYWLNLYFLAQDIHEQATSNYLHYEKIHHNFSRTDLIYRIQKNIRIQAEQCATLSGYILKNQRFQLNQPDEALTNLEASMHDWIQQNPNNFEVKNLLLVLHNLKNIQEQLVLFSRHPEGEYSHLNISIDHSFQNQAIHHSPHQPQLDYDNLNLLDDDIHGIADLWLKFKQHLSPKSALFRHAIRIGFVFAVGSLISLLPFSKNGYWILLTSLFVCQMSYFATKSRLKLRTLGTLLGVILGIPVLYLVPSIEGQLLLIVIFGVAFFYLRSKKYAMATLMATLMVLLIFNLKGAGFAIILPRIIDTLIGCGLAWFAVSFIWPDWNFRNISHTISQSSLENLNYFHAVIGQYQHGKNNSMHYRTARRAAHNAHINLSSMISSLSTEPNPDNTLIHYAFRYLIYSHSQLSYISALGSHRTKLEETEILELMSWCKQLLEKSMVQITAEQLNEIEERLNQIQSLYLQEGLSHDLLLVLKQITLLIETLPELVSLRSRLLSLDIK